MNTPTNRMQGALPEDATGQPYDFGAYMDEAVESLQEADRLHMHRHHSVLTDKERRERIEHSLSEAERMIEAARKVML
jgi:hypothetical protein